MDDPDEGMEFSDFEIGDEFVTAEKSYRWRVTDIGTRTVIALESVEMSVHDTATGTRTTKILTKAEAIGWFNGPPYGVAETVFDEYDFESCSPVRE